MRQRLLVVLAGAVAGALAGLLVTLLGRRGDARWHQDTNAERERVVQERIDLVTQRELELARRVAALTTREGAVEGPVPVVAEPHWKQEPPPADPAAVILWRIEKLVADHPSDDVFVQTDREATLFLLRDYVGVDGRPAGTVSLYSPTTTRRAVVFARSWRRDGKHSVAVHPLGARPGTTVDAFVLLR